HERGTWGWVAAWRAPPLPTARSGRRWSAEVGELHSFAEAGEEELARRASELGLEGAVALGVGAEAGGARDGHQVALARLSEADQLEQAQAGSVTDERGAHVPVELTAELARVNAELARERGEAELWAFREELEGASGKDVGRADDALVAAPSEPVEALPELGARLLGGGAIDELARAVDGDGALALCEPHVQRHDLLVRRAEHLGGIRRVEPDGVEVQIGRALEQNVVLSGGEREQLSL